MCPRGWCSAGGVPPDTIASGDSCQGDLHGRSVTLEGIQCLAEVHPKFVHAGYPSVSARSSRPAVTPSCPIPRRSCGNRSARSASLPPMAGASGPCHVSRRLDGSFACGHIRSGALDSLVSSRGCQFLGQTGVTTNNLSPRRDMKRCRAAEAAHPSSVMAHLWCSKPAGSETHAPRSPGGACPWAGIQVQDG